MTPSEMLFNLLEEREIKNNMGEGIMADEDCIAIFYPNIKAKKYPDGSYKVFDTRGFGAYKEMREGQIHEFIKKHFAI